jgi:DNA-binding LacI/PurR family transcriptional regulator
VYYLVDLRHQLTEAGHTATFARKTICELGMDAGRVARLVEETEADAWVVVAGPREVLLWFAARPAPAFAMFGRSFNVPLASTSPSKREALHEVVDRLVSLGHRRIVMIAREDRRKPEPGFFERLYLEKLESCGIPTSAYNLPDWGDRPEELQRILNSLFNLTPPTALIIADVVLFFAVQQHLSRLGIHAPEHVSLVCTDASPSFDWCRPTIAHIDWDFVPLVKRVVNWANSVSCGKDDRRKSGTKARFVIGGTIGSANASKR